MRHLATALSIGALGCSFSGAQVAGGDASIDAGDATDASDTDAPPLPLGACGSPGAIRGAFLEREWVPARGQDVTLEAEAIQVRPSSTSETASLTSKKAVDLRESAIIIEVSRFPDGSEDIIGSLQFALDDDNSIGWRFTSTALIAGTRTGGTVATTLSIPLDTEAHRFLKLKEVSGSVLFETSTDGVVFETRADIPSPSYVHAGNISLRARRNSNSGSSNAFIEWKNLNASVNPALWCSADTLSDNFDAATASWRGASLPLGSERCDNPEITGGIMLLSQFPGSAFTHCSFTTAMGFDLTNASASIELDPINSFEATWRTFIELVSDSDETLRLYFESDQMCASHIDGDGEAVASAFDSCIGYQSDNSHRYWRLAYDGAVLSAEVSGDLLAWSMVASGPPPFALDSVRVRIGTESDDLSGYIGLNTTAYNP